MTKNPDKQIIKEFLNFYFEIRKSQFQRTVMLKYESLINAGVLFETKENKEVLELEGNSILLQEVVLDIAERKLRKELPHDISEAFKFIDKFDETLKKEYDCERVINSFSTVIRGLRGYSLFILYKKDVDIKSFMLSLDDENRENHLYSLESSFFNFLPFFDYSEKEIFEILKALWESESKRHDVITGLRKLPSINLEKGNRLLEYGCINSEPLHYLGELLIGLYNAGDSKSIDKIVELKDKSPAICLDVLGRINFEGGSDAEIALNQIGELDFDNIEVANQQSYLIRNIIENENTTEATRKIAFKLYTEFIKNGAENVVNIIIREVYYIQGYDADKYTILLLYLSKTKNFKIIKDYFSYFKDPSYIFDIMMRLFNTTPNYRFSTSLFESGIRHGWNTNQTETERLILNLFKQHPAFGMLGVKVIFTAYLGIFQVDFLKLDKSEYQLNAINSICKHPYSFDKILPLILPLRNSKLKGVRGHLQKHLAQKVFTTYHGKLYNQIESNISKNKKDKEFIKPIKKALDDYNKLKELKESINDLNPYENERDLMDLYYRLEHEQNAKLMNEVNRGKGTFMEMIKTSIIVRGNSFKFDKKAPTPLGKFESSMLIDGGSYLNPDLFEHKLNIN